MAIYDKPVRILMKDMADEFGLAPGETFTRKDAIDWFADHYPKIKAGTITAHLIRMSTNAPSRLHYSAKPKEDDLFYQLDGGHFRLYDLLHDPLPIHHRDEVPDQLDTRDEELSSVGRDEFAYERDLRNYLVKNLSVIEQGLRLFEEDGINGIEFPVGGRFIDILAVDSTGALVVIELKVSRGYDRVIGQIMRYIAWIQQNQAESLQKVRGVIVAREISEDLKLACSLLKEVQLYEYELSFSLKHIDVKENATKEM